MNVQIKTKPPMNPLKHLHEHGQAYGSIFSRASLLRGGPKSLSSGMASPA